MCVCAQACDKHGALGLRYQYEEIGSVSSTGNGAMTLSVEDY